MKKYIKPSITAVSIETSSILAGSLHVGISDDPATGAACSKEQNFFEDEENEY